MDCTPNCCKDYSKEESVPELIAWGDGFFHGILTASCFCIVIIIIINFSK